MNNFLLDFTNMFSTPRILAYVSIFLAIVFLLFILIRYLVSSKKKNDD